MLDQTTAVADPTLQQLIAERQRIAPEAFAGDKQAKGKWDSLTLQIGELETQAKLAEDARVEKQRREWDEEQQRLALVRQEKEDLLATKRTEYHEKLRALDVKFRALAPQIQEAIDAGKQVYGLSVDLGVSMRWRVKSDIAQALRVAVNPVLWPEMGEHVAPSHRLPLAPEENHAGKENGSRASAAETIELMPDPCPDPIS